MNCRRVQDLISPYLDHELTGQQMLEVRQHLNECRECGEEFVAVRQIKMLLGSLAAGTPAPSLEGHILGRLDREAAGGRMIDSWIPLSVRPQRGRRLATALALSCLAILSVAAPFAPSTVDVTSARPSALAPLMSDLGRSSLLLEPSSVGVRPSGLMTADLMRPVVAPTLPAPPPAREEGTHEVLFVQQYAQPPFQEPGAAPLSDEAVGGYVRGSVTLAGSR